MHSYESALGLVVHRNIGRFIRFKGSSGPKCDHSTRGLLIPQKPCTIKQVIEIVDDVIDSIDQDMLLCAMPNVQKKM